MYTHNICVELKSCFPAGGSSLCMCSFTSESKLPRGLLEHTFDQNLSKVRDTLTAAGEAYCSISSIRAAVDLTSRELGISGSFGEIHTHFTLPVRLSIRKEDLVEQLKSY